MNFQNDIQRMTAQAIQELENSPIKQRTNKARLEAIGNIYFLYSNGVLKYIGQRQASGIKTRLDQHLFGKSYSEDVNGKQNGTISKWHKVKIELQEANEITFNTILVLPDSLRTTIEEELINKYKPEWNIQGK